MINALMSKYQCCIGIWLQERSEAIQISVNPNKPSQNQNFKLYVIGNALYKTEKNTPNYSLFQKISWKCCRLSDFEENT